MAASFLPHLIASLEQVNQTYIMEVKPDGLQRGLMDEIITRFEKKGFKLTGLKLFRCSKELAEEHYKDLKGKSFFPKLIDYITSGPVVCMFSYDGIVLGRTTFKCGAWNRFLIFINNGPEISAQKNEEPKRSAGGKSHVKKQSNKKGVVDLGTLLAMCAQAISYDDRVTANKLLNQISGILPR